MRRSGHTHRGWFLVKYIQPALAAGLIEMTLPDKPKSKLQQYRRRRLGGVQEEARP
ncbi:MAG: Fic family protein [Oligosphaeraceae bacterium]